MNGTEKKNKTKIIYGKIYIFVVVVMIEGVANGNFCYFFYIPKYTDFYIFAASSSKLNIGKNHIKYMEFFFFFMYARNRTIVECLCLSVNRMKRQKKEAEEKLVKKSE